MSRLDGGGEGSPEALVSPGAPTVDEPSWSVLARALAPERRRAGLVLVAVTLAAVSEAVGVGLVVPLIAIVLEVGDIRGASGAVARVQDVLAAVAPGGGLLLPVCILIAVVYLLKMGLTILASYLSHSFVLKMRARWMGDMLEGYLWWNYKSLLLWDRGELINNVTNETISAQKAVKFALGYVSRLLVAGAIYVMMLLVNWQITLALSVLGGSIAGLFWGASQRYSLAVGRRSLHLNQTLASKAEESLRAIREVKVFGLERRIVASWRTSMRDCSCSSVCWSRSPIRPASC